MICIKRFRHIKSWHALLSILAATFRLDVRFGSKAGMAALRASFGESNRCQLKVAEWA
jgi:hypothetical protein